MKTKRVRTILSLGDFLADLHIFDQKVEKSETNIKSRRCDVKLKKSSEIKSKKSKKVKPMSNRDGVTLN